MYLVENTYTVDASIADSHYDMGQYIGKAIRTALSAYGVTGEQFDACPYHPDVDAEMTEDKRLLFKSNHFYQKDGKSIIRTVVMVTDKEAYDYRLRTMLAFPEGLSEADLDLTPWKIEVSLSAEDLSKG